MQSITTAIKRKNIITIQHPESVHHTNGMVGSWTDWELSEKGKRLAENISSHLKQTIQPGSVVIYSSTLKRAVQTAEIVGKKLGLTPKLIGALKERGLGAGIGKSVQWLKDNIEQEELTVYEKYFADAESR